MKKPFPRTLFIIRGVQVISIHYLAASSETEVLYEEVATRRVHRVDFNTDIERAGIYQHEIDAIGYAANAIGKQLEYYQERMKVLNRNL